MLHLTILTGCERRTSSKRCCVVKEGPKSTLWATIVDDFLKRSCDLDDSEVAWWKTQYTALGTVNASYLGMKASPAASERVFSLAGSVVEVHVVHERQVSALMSSHSCD